MWIFLLLSLVSAQPVAIIPCNVGTVNCTGAGCGSYRPQLGQPNYGCCVINSITAYWPNAINPSQPPDATQRRCAAQADGTPCTYHSQCASDYCGFTDIRFADISTKRCGQPFKEPLQYQHQPIVSHMVARFQPCQTSEQCGVNDFCYKLRINCNCGCGFICNDYTINYQVSFYEQFTGVFRDAGQGKRFSCLGGCRETCYRVFIGMCVPRLTPGQPCGSRVFNSQVHYYTQDNPPESTAKNIKLAYTDFVCSSNTCGATSLVPVRTGTDFQYTFSCCPNSQQVFHVGLPFCAGRALGQPCYGNNFCTSGFCANYLNFRPTQPGVCSLAPAGTLCTQNELCLSGACGYNFATLERNCCSNNCLYARGDFNYCGPVPNIPLRVGSQCAPEINPFDCPWQRCAMNASRVNVCCPSCNINAGFCV